MRNICSASEGRRHSAARPTAKGLSRSLSVSRTHQQIRRIERGIHAASVVRPDGGFNLHRVQNPFGDLSIGDGSERRENNEFCGFHAFHPFVLL
jgi:hypothetical protein